MIRQIALLIGIAVLCASGFVAVVVLIFALRAIDPAGSVAAASVCVLSYLGAMDLDTRL